MNISVTTDIRSPKSEVWAAITDFDNCVDMISAIIDLKVINRPEQGWVGFKWQETRQMFGKEATETMWITECEDESYYLTRAENHGAVYVTRVAVQDKGDMTELSMSFSASANGFFARLMSTLMGWLMKKSMIKMIQTDLDDIKRHVEQQSS